MAGAATALCSAPMQHMAGGNMEVEEGGCMARWAAAVSGDSAVSNACGGELSHVARRYAHGERERIEEGEERRPSSSMRSRFETGNISINALLLLAHTDGAMCIAAGATAPALSSFVKIFFVVATTRNIARYFYVIASL